MQLSKDGIEDLELSGLTPADLRARPITATEMGASNASNMGFNPDGYVIPYFNIHGKSIAYYRIKLLGTAVKVKYLAISGANNHVYFPPGLANLLLSGADYIVITEGEKKAACAVANGVPCVAFAGVDSWRTRTVLIPASSNLTEIKQTKMIKAKLPSGDSHGHVQYEAGIAAEGFEDLVNMIVGRRMQVLIIYDTDEGGVKREVQRAAAVLGYELRYRGVPIPNIRQIVLPAFSGGRKMALDDYIMSQGVEKLVKLIKTIRGKRSAFPQHPNVKLFIANKLQVGRHSRKEIQDIAMSALMELESKGRRLRNKDTGTLYYFDETTNVLMEVNMNNPKIMLHDTPFGGHLYREYNVGTADTKMIQWLASQFSGEPGIEETTTHKITAIPPGKPNHIAYQISDTHYVLVTPHQEKPFVLCENGTNGILFEQDQVAPLDSRTLMHKLTATKDETPKMLWSKVVDSFNFTVDTDTPASRMSADLEQSKKLAALLFYISPWLLRWNGTQLPVELMVGEAGSGKSSLYALRQSVISGKPRLSNMTKDIKDWYSGITSRGGLFVLDNIKFTGTDKDYQQRLSDEICRIITEPDPRVEVRKLYTTSEIASMPVSCTFAVTSIAQPFHNVDILQRAAIFEMQSIASTGTHDARWMDRMLEMGGGRLGWIAHHLIVLHRFLNLGTMQRQWDPDYKAHHRLANYEQALMLMAHVFEIDNQWIPDALKVKTEHSMTETDWTLSIIKVFTDSMKEDHPTNFEMKKYSAGEIGIWASERADYAKNEQITNAWKLGKYLKTHGNIIKSATGMYERRDKMANKAMYSILRRSDDPKA